MLQPDSGTPDEGGTTSVATSNSASAMITALRIRPVARARWCP